MPGPFIGVAFKLGQPIVKGASKKFMKIFKKEYNENRAAGLSSTSAHREASQSTNKILKEFK
jgi:hypothetical protein|tara:strand:+ start:745 stop:930 length:186 start_codon:yes stop_codon:yes gene_type:complete